MPKIIKNLEANLIQEAKRQVRELGYGALTIRSVAKACGVGVGTVYNYFSSKDELLATYMLSDWELCIAEIQAVSDYVSVPEPVLRCIYDELLAYAQRHQTVFRDEAAGAAFASSFGRYHAVLRRQLAEPVRKFCGSDFTAEFIAESLLCWTMAGKTFDEIYGVIGKLF